MNDKKSEIDSILKDNINLKKRIGELEMLSHNWNLESKKNKRAEDKIDFLSEIVRQTNSAIIMTGLDFKITWVNDAFTKLYGFSSKEVIGRNPGFLNAESNSEEIQNKIYRAVENGESFQSNLLNIRKDGSTFTCNVRIFPLFDNNKNIIAYSSHLNNITEQMKSAQAINKEKEFSEKVIETSNAIIVGLDKNHIIRIFNKGAEKISGYTKKEVIGKDWFEIFFPLDQVNEMNKVWKSSWGIQSHSYENPIVIKTGEKRIISWQTTGMYDDKDENNHLSISIGEDITEQKKVETELINSKNRYHKLFDDHGAAKLLIDSDTLNIVEANKAAVKFYGWSKDELTSMKISQINTLSTEEIKQEMDSARSSQKQYFEFKHRRANGSIRNVAVYSNPIVTDDKTLLHSIIHDITEQKKAEAEIKAERDKLTSIFESMEDGVYIANKNYDIQFVNSVLIKEYGNYEGKKCHKYFRDSDEPCTFCKNDDVFAGKTVHWEWISKKNGKTYDLIDTPLINADGSISKLEILRDITSRKLIEQKLKESKLKYQLLADFTYDWEYWIDPIGEYIYLSPSVERITGYIPQEFKTNPDLLFNLVREDYREQISNHYKSENNIDQPVKSLKFPIITKSGEEKWIAHLCSPVFDKSGSWIGRRGNNRDITEQIIAEKKLRKSEFLLNETQKISKVGGWEYRIADGDTIWTDEVFNIYGIPKGTVPAPEDGIKFYHKDDIPAIAKAFEKCVTEGIEYNLEVRFTNAQKKNMWVHTSGKPIVDEGKIEKIVGNIMDITDSKEAEMRLKSKNKELQIFYDSAVGRELKMIELKNEINELLKKAGEKPKYDIPI